MPRIKQTNKSRTPDKAYQKQEIFRCGKDPIYFINKYIYIQHPVKGKLPFHTFEYQDTCVKAYLEGKNVITNKSRQLGLSTISAAYSLWLALFRRDKNVLIIATKLGVAQNFMTKVFYALDFLPKWLTMPQVVKKTKTEIRFSNGSQIKAIPTSPDAGRSEALTLLIVDEAAHVDNMDDIWVGIQPTLSTGGQAILISSPNGVGNVFHRVWVDAQNGENDFVPFELPWTVHPERDQEWYEKESRNIRAGKGERGVQQEFWCSFNSSGETFVEGPLIQWMEEQTCDPMAKHPQYKDCWVWEYAQPGHRYLVCADVSRGNAKDFSTAHVIDTDSDTVVAEYRSKIPADQFADILLDLGRKYNDALICPELNTYGAITAQKLKESGYANLFYEKIHRNLYMGFSNIQPGPEDLPGFTMTSKTRDEVMAKLENVLRNRKLKINSKRFTSELQTFIWKNNKAQALKGYNDDLIMALAIGVSLYESAGKQQYSNDDYMKAMLAGISVNTSKMGRSLDNWGETYKEHHSNPLFAMTSKNPGFKPRDNAQQGSKMFKKEWGWILDE